MDLRKEEDIEAETEDESEEERGTEEEIGEQRMCSKGDPEHDKYVKYDVFVEDDYYLQMKHTMALKEEDCKELHTLLKRMADLTGLFLLQTSGDTYTGTGFISRIRRQYDKHCPCLSEGHGESDGQYAIVTISTAYHIFNSNEETDIKSFDRCQEIWKYSCVEFKLDYHSGEDSKDKSVITNQLKGLPTLYGHQLIESDLDLDFKCDWCAIECVTHDQTLIELLEKTLQDYQTLMASLYKKSKTYTDVINLVVIIGHPHSWPKKISFGQSHDFDTIPKKFILKELRSQQVWCRYSYDNITCFGSSGSPVFIWGQPITGFGYWFGHPHNHAKETVVKLDEDNEYTIGLSTVGVEHVN